MSRSKSRALERLSEITLIEPTCGRVVFYGLALCSHKSNAPDEEASFAMLFEPAASMYDKSLYSLVIAQLRTMDLGSRTGMSLEHGRSSIITGEAVSAR